MFLQAGLDRANHLDPVQQIGRFTQRFFMIMAGLVPAIHVFSAAMCGSQL
jgi:hypothetical protein